MKNYINFRYGWVDECNRYCTLDTHIPVSSYAWEFKNREDFRIFRDIRICIKMDVWNNEKFKKPF